MGKFKDIWAHEQELDYTGLRESLDSWKRAAEKVKYSCMNKPLKTNQEEFAQKYPQTDWLLYHVDDIKEGDEVIYKDDSGKEVRAKFLEFLSNDKEVIFVQREDKIGEIINWHNQVVFINPYNKAKVKAKECTCGAKHTSVPTHHSTWCDIK